MGKNSCPLETHGNTMHYINFRNKKIPIRILGETTQGRTAIITADRKEIFLEWTHGGGWAKSAQTVVPTGLIHKDIKKSMEEQNA